MKKMLSFALALMLMLSITSTAFAAGEEGSDNAPQLDPIFELTDNIAEAPQNDTSSAAPNRTVITGTITDVSTIQSLVNDGTVECDQNGNIPTKIVVTQIIDNPSFDPPSVDTRSTQPKSPISISKTDYYDGRYLEEYDRYEIDGPSEFTKTYSRTSTASWNSDMSASVEVSGNLYSVAEVKAAVSSSMGYTIGTSYTSTSQYKVNIPANKKWEIKVWTSYRVFTYTAKVGSVKIATGKSWYPNGLVILHTEYNV